jgi:hypothetical protein
VSKAPQRIIDLAYELRPVCEEVRGLLCNRYIFGTLLEIVRRNPRLQGQPRGKFSEWTQVLYAVAASVSVRRLVSGSYQRKDVSLTRVLDDAIRDASDLFPCFNRHFPSDAKRALLAARRGNESNLETNACKRLLGTDRRQLLAKCRGAIEFGSRRAAHNNPSVEVSTKFHDLDQAIHAIRATTEKLGLLLYDEPRDLSAEMMSRKLRRGWDSIFLEAWATEETLKLPLGEMVPPSR